MPYQRLMAAEEKSVGSKQTLRALKKDLAEVVYVATDAEECVVEPVVKLCEEQNVPVIKVDSMKSLGRACSIKVDCAVAAIIKKS